MKKSQRWFPNLRVLSHRSFETSSQKDLYSCMNGNDSVKTGKRSMIDNDMSTSELYAYAGLQCFSACFWAGEAGPAENMVLAGCM